MKNGLTTVQVCSLVGLSLIVGGCGGRDWTRPPPDKYLIYREFINAPDSATRSEIVYNVHAVRDDGAALMTSLFEGKLTCTILGTSIYSAAAARAAIRKTSSLPPRNWEFSGPGSPTDSITYGVEGNTLRWAVVPGTFMENALRFDQIEEYQDFMAGFIGTRLYIKRATLRRELGRKKTILQSDYNLLPLVGDYWDPDKAMGMLESIFPPKVKQTKRH